MSDQALFVPDGELWVPTDFARGPWTPDALHGGPVAALVTRAAETCESPGPMSVARLTIELLRPVPVAPLEVNARISRPGRKVQLVDVSVTSGGTELAWGRVLKVQLLAEDSEAFAELEQTSRAQDLDEAPKPPPGPQAGRSSGPLVEGYTAFHNSGAELRFVEGRFDARGPASVWVRLAVAVVSGEDPSPSQRAAAAADFGNGVSSALDFSRWIFINPDLNVSLDRPPSGEWICLEATTRLGIPGHATSHCVLWDERGPIGRSLQTLLVEPRASPLSR